MVLFHSGISLFSGGFLGVDVFFVISGYLITSIILDDLGKNSFFLLKFYERRDRRILPALSVVVLVCIPIAWFTMLPDPLENFGQSVVATMFSLNNVLLTLTSGYWDLASEFKPLVHTWSLAVEEQFYIVFPLLLMALYPVIKHRTDLLVWAIIGSSFLASVLLVQTHPESTFYLLHTRAWELGFGALGACWENKRKVRASNSLSLLGLIAVIASMVIFDGTMQHPSYLTAVPVVGSLLVLLYAKEGTFVAKLLSIRILVGIGLISYSLYLWHQPIFAFARIASFEEPSPYFLASLIPFAFLLSYLTWRFVEQPFRNKNAISLSRLVVSCTAVTATLCAVGLSLYLGQGFPTRVFDTDREVAAGMHIWYNHRISQYDADKFDTNSGINVLIVGNSQARDFANILIEMGIMKDANLIYRDALNVCEPRLWDDDTKSLIQNADATFLPIVNLSGACKLFLENGLAAQHNIVFVGPKHFGYNLNAFTLLPRYGRPNYTTKVFEEIVEANRQNASVIPAGLYVDIISYATTNGNQIHVFDQNGDIISADRVHITQAGAQFFALLMKDHPAFEIFF